MGWFSAEHADERCCLPLGPQSGLWTRLAGTIPPHSLDGSAKTCICEKNGLIYRLYYATLG